MARKQKVTVYALNIYGQVFKDEVALHSHGRTDSMAGNERDTYGGGAPYIRFTEPPKRKLSGYTRTDGLGRYLLILDGTCHPDPIRLGVGLAEDNCHRDFRLLAPWEELINAHIARYRVKVIGDYRDILDDPRLRRAIWVDEQRWGRDRPDLADVAAPEPVAAA